MQLRNILARVSRPRHTALRSVAAAALLALTGACTDAPSAPATDVTPSASLLGGTLGLVGDAVTILTSPLRARSVTRTAPIAAESASVVIGRAGGTLVLPGAGLTVTVPAGAVSEPTTFRVVAPAGTAVWYEFAPHGLRFATPLRVTQSLRGTNANLVSALTLRAGYYRDGTADPATNTALVTELLPINLNALTGKLSFSVRHFSGYIVAWGFAD